jgi:hypothetical protein
MWKAQEKKKYYKLISLKNVNIFINEIADLVSLQKN